MIYVFVSYNYSPDFDTPESWCRRTEGYNGVLECLSTEHIVINVKQINYEGDHIHNGVLHRFVNFGKKKTYFPGKLNHFVKSLNPDIVVIHGLHHPLQLIQLGLILNKNTRIIAQHHAEQPFTGVRKYIQRVACGYIDAYLFASLHMGMEWVKKGNLGPAKKIHEVMEVSSSFSPVKKADARLKTDAEGGPVFLWVGRLNENKDPLNVVRAFLKFAKLNPPARLYMVYQTDELLTGIKELLKSGADKKAVILIGKVDHDELLYWYNSADYFISGSHYEGSGTAVCEAMSCGCIPIVTDIFSFRMITNNGDCGILYKAGDEGALLNALLQTRQLNLEEQREKVLSYFKSNLSFEAIAGKVQRIAASL